MFIRSTLPPLISDTLVTVLIVPAAVQVLSHASLRPQWEIIVKQQLRSIQNIFSQFKM